MANTEKTNELEMAPSPLEKIVIKIDDMEQSMGFWYSLFAKRIVPFLLYIIPVNVILGRINGVIAPYFPGVNLNGTILLVSWIVVMLGFLAITIFAPKAATVVEFVLGFAYLFLAFRFHLYNSALGYVILFWMIIFLLVKTVFLVFKIIRLKVAAGDEKGVERDESGRIVRASEEEVFFVKEDKNAEDEIAAAASDDDVFFVRDDKNTDDEIAVASDDDVLFVNEDKNAENEIAAAVSNDEVFFVSEDENAENEIAAKVSDDEVFFVKDDDDKYREGMISESDNDYFFG